jgi:hypothetical protein
MTDTEEYRAAAPLRLLAMLFVEPVQGIDDTPIARVGRAAAAVVQRDDIVEPR